MPVKSSNIPPSMVYSAIDAESLRITSAINNPESFCTAIKPFIACMTDKGSFEKINSVIPKCFNKHQGDLIMFVKISKNCYS